MESLLCGLVPVARFIVRKQAGSFIVILAGGRRPSPHLVIDTIREA